jgi:hypothetical protein
MSNVRTKIIVTNIAYKYFFKMMLFIKGIKVTKQIYLKFEESI